VSASILASSRPARRADTRGVDLRFAPERRARSMSSLGDRTLVAVSIPDGLLRNRRAEPCSRRKRQSSSAIGARA
jgi:hypothetical protein